MLRDKGKASAQILYERYILGRRGIVSVILLTISLYLVSLFSPLPIHTLQITVADAKAISSGLLGAYTSVLGIGLAISAVILAIVQIANRQLTIINLIFNRTYFIPLVYFGLINIVLIGLSQLLYQRDNHVFYEEQYIQCIIASIYSFAFFIFLTFIVFYRTFRYLNFFHVVDAYLKKVYRHVYLNKSKNYLSISGREVYGEIATSIEREDNIMLEKLLGAIVTAFKINPDSTFLFEIDNKMAEWHAKAINDKNWGVYDTLISVWREIRTYVAKQPTTDVYIRSRFSNVAAATIIRTAPSIEETAYVYALHLKEMLIFSRTTTEADAGLSTTYEQASIFLKDIIALIDSILNNIDDMERSIGALEQVINQVEMTIGYLSSDISEVENRFQKNIPNEEERIRSKQQKKLLDSIFSSMLSFFSIYAYKIYRNTGKRMYPTIFDLLTRIFERYSHDYNLETISMINQPEIFNWREWVWSMEKRIDGQIYTVEDGDAILALGKLLLYIKYEFLMPTQSDVIIQRYLEQFRKNDEHLLRVLPGIDSDSIPNILQRLQEILNELNNQQKEDQRKQVREAPRSFEKIRTFKEKMTSQWESSRLLYRLFDTYGAIVKNPTEDLKQVGTPMMNIHEGRAMFVDEPLYMPVYGIEWGHQVNTSIARLFIDKVAKINNPKQSTSITAALSEFNSPELKKSDAGDKGWVALIPNRAAYKWCVELVNSGNYQDLPAEQNPYPFSVMGIYNGKTPLVRINRSISDQTLILIKLPAAMKYKIKTKEAFEKEQLQVEVILHEDAGTIQAPKPVPGRDGVSSDNVFVTVQEIMDFEIVDENFIKVINIIV